MVHSGVGPTADDIQLWLYEMQ